MSDAVRVYKIGGRALDDAALIGALAMELQQASEWSLLVHGGGSRVTELSEKLGIESRFVDGRRATSPEAMEVVEMVLSGLTNKRLVAELTAAGLPAIGLSGRDGRMIRARLEPGLGRVGRPDTIDVRPLHSLWREGWVPVVSPVCAGPEDEAINVNADETALALAHALSARSLVYLSDVDGVRIDESFVPEMDAAMAREAIARGAIGEGMRLKVDMALEAAGNGIGEVVVAGAARLLGGFAGTRIVSRTAA